MKFQDMVGRGGGGEGEGEKEKVSDHFFGGYFDAPI
jgi:hypothetical protein